jgi:hypothetical protein
VVEEMPANGGSGKLEAWVYLSEACGSTPRRFRVLVRDSSQSASGITLAIALVPADVGRPRLVNQRFDVDVPGSSDGSQSQSVRPDLRFELAHDVEGLGNAVSSARLGYQAPEDLRGLFQSFAMRDAPLGRDGALYRAGDDLDSTMVGREVFREALRKATNSKQWSVRSQQSRLWLAADLTVLADPPGASAQGSKAKPEAAPLCRAPLPAKQIVELARKYLLVEARPANPVLPGSVMAVEGYEAGIDAEGLIAAYEKLLDPPPPPAPEAEPPVAYSYRYYLALPLISTAPAPSAPAPVPVPVPPKPEPEPQGSSLRLDVGGLWSGYSTNPPAAGSSFWRDVGFVNQGGGKLQVTAGQSVAFTARASYSVAKLDPGEGYSAFGNHLAWMWFRELEIGAGLAYVARFEPFEIEPYAICEYRNRLMNGFDRSQGIGGLVGATARMRLHEYVGAYLDLSWKLGRGGPTGGVGQELVSGAGPAAGAGLTFFLR